MDKKQRAFSGIQPSGAFTLGNYIGALCNWEKMQDDYEGIFSVVNMHAITVRQNAAELRKSTLNAAAMLLAMGINPEKSIVFVQSHVPAHAELSWVLSCNTMFGELSRMTQFKDKSKKHADNINGGLFTYPVLMAADILLYNADVVPVGIDQKQHVELARNIAERFNNAYSPTFTVPEPVVPKKGAKIQSLTNPEAKMSKSDDNQNSYVLMEDKPETIMKKFKRAVTDSEGAVYRSEEKPGVSNLMTIYSVMTNKTDDEITAEFKGVGYGEFKETVAQSVIDVFEPIQTRYNEVLNDKAALEKALADGAQKANYLAGKMLAKVYRKVGF